MKQPTIAIAKEIAKKHNANGVLILCFDDKNFLSASFGITKAECRKYGKLLEDIADLIESGELSV
jgi:hypothetical protein